MMKKVIQTLGATLVLSSAVTVFSPFSAVNAETGRAIIEPSVQCSALSSIDFSGVPDAPLHINSSRIVAATDEFPGFCEVKGYVAPQVGFELRLPLTDWEGRFLHQGCGGFCGRIYIQGCNDALARNYAVVASNMGHKSSAFDGKWAYNNRQAEIDFGYRATHVTTVGAKAIIKAFYGTKPKYSYYRGCSTGGRQGMVSAQQFPEDFDGIIAGAPPMNEVEEAVFGLGWPVLVNMDENGAPILTAKKLELLHGAVIASCDENDGILDGVIGDPSLCSFDVSSLKCAGRLNDKCLTTDQIGVIQKIYAGAEDRNGNKLVPGGPPLGSEVRWAGFVRNDAGVPGHLERMVVDFLRYMAFSEDPGPDYTLESFDYVRDRSRLNFMERIYNAENANLLPFRDSGAKLILYMGLEDSFTPQRLINYYKSVESLVESDVDEFFRFYLVPGMAHCSGGNGVSAFDWLTIMQNWVERGERPDMIVGHKTNSSVSGFNPIFPIAENGIEMTRPVFPYPDRAHYSGAGDPNDPESFIRVSPKPQ